MNAKEVKQPTLIFSTQQGLKTIKSPVKIKILNQLSEGKLSFHEIVDLNEKSKSTISAHLKSLTEDGLISFQPHPSDQRKKIFYINSKYMGTLEQHNVWEREEEKVEFLLDKILNNGDPFEFFKLTLHLIRVTMIKEGINIDPILTQSGLRIGEVIYRQLNNPSVKQLIPKLEQFWKSNGLGTLTLENNDPITIKVVDCFECGLLPQISKSACALDVGILESVFSQAFQREIFVEETKCYAKGDSCCLFVVHDTKL